MTAWSGLACCFQALLAKKLPPPIVPDITSVNDLSRFDINDSLRTSVAPYIPTKDKSNWDAEF